MVIVENPFDEVFSRFGEAVLPIVGEGNYGTDVNPIMTSDKYARIAQLGMPTMTKDLEGNEVATNLSVQTEAYASGMTATTNCYTIDNAIHRCMIGMGFLRTFGPELMRNADSRITRLVSRYARVYTGQLPNRED